MEETNSRMEETKGIISEGKTKIIQSKQQKKTDLEGKNFF